LPHAAIEALKYDRGDERHDGLFDR